MHSHDSREQPCKFTLDLVLRCQRLRARNNANRKTWPIDRGEVRCHIDINMSSGQALDPCGSTKSALKLTQSARLSLPLPNWYHTRDSRTLPFHVRTWWCIQFTHESLQLDQHFSQSGGRAIFSFYCRLPLFQLIK